MYPGSAHVGDFGLAAAVWVRAAAAGFAIVTKDDDFRATQPTRGVVAFGADPDGALLVLVRPS